MNRRIIVAAFLLCVLASLIACGMEPAPSPATPDAGSLVVQSAPETSPPEPPTTTPRPATPTAERIPSPSSLPAAPDYPVQLVGHSAAVVDAAFSPDGARLVTAGEDGLAIIWEVATGTQVTVLSGHEEALTSVQFDFSGWRAVTASYDRTARLWDLASGRQLILEGEEGSIQDAIFSPDGSRAVTAGSTGSVRLWDSFSGELLHTLREAGEGITTLAFAPDGSRLAAGDADGFAWVWNAVDGAELLSVSNADLPGQVTNLAIRAIAFSPDGARLLAASDDGAAYIWDAVSGERLQRIGMHGRGVVVADLSQAGGRLAAASLFSGVAGTWRAADGAALASVSHGAIINDVALSPDGAVFVTAGTDDRAILWDAATGAQRAVLGGHTGGIRVTRFSPDGRLIVTADNAGFTQVWSTAAAIAMSPAEEAADFEMALSPDGPWALYAGIAGLWASNPDGSGLAQLADHEILDPTGIGAWIAPVGGRFAYVTAEDGAYNATLHVVSLPSFDEIAGIALTSAATEPARDATPGDAALDAVSAAVRPGSLAWSPDGGRLAFVGMIAGPTADVYLLDVMTGAVTQLTDGPTQAGGLTWSPDGRVILHEALTGSAIDTGFHVDGLWAAAEDGSTVTPVIDGEAFFLGWVGSETFLAYDIDLLCGRHDLRAIGTMSGETQTVWEGYFDHAAGDPGGNAILVAVRGETGSSTWCNGDGRSGLFLADRTGTALPVVEDDVSEMIWSEPAGLFFARTELGMLAVSPAGRFIDLVVPAGSFGFPDVAPISRDLAWAGEPLWLGALTNSIDQPPVQLYAGLARWARWLPDGSGLLFADLAGTIYRAEGPEYAVERAADLPGAGGPAWVRP